MRSDFAKTSIWILPLTFLSGFCCFLWFYLLYQAPSRFNYMMQDWLVTLVMLTPIIVFLIGLWLIWRLVQWSAHKIDNPPKKKRKR